MRVQLKTTKNPVNPLKGELIELVKELKTTVKELTTKVKELEEKMDEVMAENAQLQMKVN